MVQPPIQASFEPCNGLLFGMGNTLLDLIVNGDEELINKYNLQPNVQLIAGKDREGIFDDLKKRYKVKYHCGGCVYNSFKILQWMLQTPIKTTDYFCSIGKDDYAEAIKSDSVVSNVNAHFYQTDDAPTGICAVCITGSNRSLVARPGAAFCYNKEKHLDLPDKWKLVERAKYYYIAGHFTLSSPESIVKVAEYSSDNNKHFTFNLSAPYICSQFKAVLDRILPHIDILFGNDEEYKAFSEANNFNTEDLREVARKAQQLPKVNKNKSRIVIITQNKYDTIVATEDGVKTYPVVKVNEEDIVDTLGAGDAFVGGFLSQYIQGKHIDECVRAGHYAASVTIKQLGSTVPHFKPNFT